VELANPFHTLGDPSLSQYCSLLVQHADVVMRFRPIDSDKDHASPPNENFGEPEETRVELIDQCSRHDIPPVVYLLAGRWGHALVIGLEAQLTQCSPSVARWNSIRSTTTVPALLVDPATALAESA
jgi:hypothetical protein